MTDRATYGNAFAAAHQLRAYERVPILWTRSGAKHKIPGGWSTGTKVPRIGPVGITSGLLGRNRQRSSDVDPDAIS